MGALFTIAFAFPLFWLLESKSAALVTTAVMVAMNFGHGMTFGLNPLISPSCSVRASATAGRRSDSALRGDRRRLLAHHRDCNGRIFRWHHGGVSHDDRTCTLHLSRSACGTRDQRFAVARIKGGCAMRFGIFIYPGVEPIHLATFGVLSMARRIAPQIEICTIGPHAGSMDLANGLQVTADFGIDEAPACDLVIVTGGPGWNAQANASATLDYVGRVHASGRIASVCTGGMILAASGILDGTPATTKREVVPPEASPLELMRATYPWIDVREALLVDTGSAVKPAAAFRSASIPRCICSPKMLGPHVADETARIMEYQRARRAIVTGLLRVLAAP